MDLIATIREFARMPHVRISLGRGTTAYPYYTSRHPRYRIIANKVWGVALLGVPFTFDEYLRGKERQALRTNRKHAIQAGFTFKVFDPIAHLEEIVEINHSRSERQGRPMKSEYMHVDALKAYCAAKGMLYGVADSKETIKAYCYAPVYGELCDITRILGHYEYLDTGIMYLLVSEIVRELSIRRSSTGVPLWLMYDTYYGAQPGLQYFKDRLGFEPYKVYWTENERKTRTFKYKDL